MLRLLIHFVFGDNDLHETLLRNRFYTAYIRTYASFVGRQEGRIEVRVSSDGIYKVLEPIEIKAFNCLTPEDVEEKHREMVRKWEGELPNYQI